MTIQRRALMSKPTVKHSNGSTSLMPMNNFSKLLCTTNLKTMQWIQVSDANETCFQTSNHFLFLIMHLSIINIDWTLINDGHNIEGLLINYGINTKYSNVSF